MAHSRSLVVSQRAAPRVDEWALISEQKALEQQRAKQYEQLLAEEKRRKLKYSSGNKGNIWMPKCTKNSKRNSSSRN
jgi:hypothetical protein